VYGLPWTGAPAVYAPITRMEPSITQKTDYGPSCGPRGAWQLEVWQAGQHVTCGREALVVRSWRRRAASTRIMKQPGRPVAKPQSTREWAVTRRGTRHIGGHLEWAAAH
jgi:hypothetical protein